MDDVWGEALVGGCVALSLAALVWFVLAGRGPEKGASHDDPPDVAQGHFAPGGPDAESQRPEDVGSAWDPPPPPGAS
jgi:hypothetical protein